MNNLYRWAAATLLPTALFAAAMITVADAQSTGQADDQTQDSPELTRQQRRDITKLEGRFRRARGDLQRQAAVVQQAMAAGPHAVVAIFDLYSRHMQPQLQRYRNMFYQQAEALSRRRQKQVEVEEVVRLRQTVLSLQKQDNFSKELIVAKGDPIMQQLERMFVVGRVEVLSESHRLPGQRQELMAAGMLWEQLAKVMYQMTPPEQRQGGKPSFQNYLQGEEELAVGMAVPMAPQTRKVLSANSRLASQLDPEESRAILALNLTRNLLGLNALLIDMKLVAAARDHSSDMRRLKFFDHTSPVPGKKTPWDRATNFGTKASGENIAMGYPDGRAVNLGWFHSPGHHVNMLGDHRRVGVGRSGNYYTQMFGR